MGGKCDDDREYSNENNYKRMETLRPGWGWDIVMPGQTNVMTARERIYNNNEIPTRGRHHLRRNRPYDLSEYNLCNHQYLMRQE